MLNCYNHSLGHVNEVKGCRYSILTHDDFCKSHNTCQVDFFTYRLL